jgi:hypothetical protein
MSKILQDRKDGWILPVMILASWILFVFTLFPIILDYLILWILTFVITLVGVVVGVLAIFSYRHWKTIAALAAISLLIRYFVHWAILADYISSSTPEANFQSIVANIFQTGLRIVEHKVSAGYIGGAILTGYNVFIMPLFQALLAAYLTIESKIKSR